jgi:transposase
MQASTDRLDLMGMASMRLNRRGNCSPAQSGIYRNLRTLVRHRKKRVAMSTEVKNRMHTVLDRIFPGFLDGKKSGILSFSKSSLYLMEDRFSPRQIHRGKRQKLIEILKRYGTAKPESTVAKFQEYATRVLNTPNEYVDIITYHQYG